MKDKSTARHFLGPHTMYEGSAAAKALIFLWLCVLDYGARPSLQDV